MTTSKTTYFAQIAEQSDSIVAGVGATVGGMSRFRLSDVLELPVSERLKLVEAIWDSIADAPETLQLTEEEHAELDRQLREYEKNPNDGSPWAEVRERILKRG
jgi:putative addiction module component (TIGR02574 family)